MVGNPSFLDSAYERGLAYLHQARSLALQPEMVYLPEGWGDRARLCPWIGSHIHAINARLEELLQCCHQRFHPQQRRSIRILAAPLDAKFGIDGCCNIYQLPAVILLDVGRVQPEDWLSLVAHEYAHAHLGQPGHQTDFVHTLNHLCLGLGLPTPPATVTEQGLRHWPPYKPVTHPLHFWMGGA